MNTMLSKFRMGIGAGAVCALLPMTAGAATSGQNGTHDPSRIIESNGKFYFCGTGGRCASSKDGLAWESTGLRIQVPSWASQYIGSGGNQGVWAPDIIHYNNKYYIYYSFCGVPAAQAPCTIGVLTTPTLDSTAAGYALTDGNKVVNNPKNTSAYQFSTIDPAPAVDQMNNLWTIWGSGYGKDTSKNQIWVTRLDNMTGLPLATDPSYKPPTQLGYGLETGAIEGAYVHYHSGYYYLFWNSGGCCNGASSTYLIHVARSQNISGPYTGAKNWYGSSGSIHGPGHIGIYSACGVERFSYHYYPDTGGSVLGLNELTWGADGWPVAGAPTSTPLKPCGDGDTSAPGTGPSTGPGAGTGTGAMGGRDGGRSGQPEAGAAGAGGDPGSGGAAGSGGSSDTAGSGGSSDTAGSGGMPDVPTPNPTTGDPPATTGTTGSGGSGGSNDSPSATGGSAGQTGGAAPQAGCSCELGASHESSAAGILSLLGLAFLAGRTRRRR